MSQRCRSHALQALGDARLVADYAERLGITIATVVRRPATKHLGAVLADTVLQPGLNYRSVVKPRVDRIQAHYPSAWNMQGVRTLLDQETGYEFLNWRHPEKVARFGRLVALLGKVGTETVEDLREWLECKEARFHLLSLYGFGPKSFDYICCLVGLDHIAVDRHIRTFASDAGVLSQSYDELQLVVSFAADLLGLSRRDFDAWIWTRITLSSKTLQYSFL